MTKFARTIPKLTVLVPLLAVLAAPTYASIAYTSCASGCSTTSGTYTSWQSAPGSTGLTFSMSPDNFAPGNLTSGVYLEPTGTVFTGYSGVSIDTLMSVTGTSLLEGNSGNGTGIEVLLPPNTYAFAMNITMLGSQFTTVAAEQNDHNASGTNYNINIASNGSVQFFSIISSGAPLTELFFWSGRSRLPFADQRFRNRPGVAHTGAFERQPDGQRTAALRTSAPPHPQTKQRRRLKRFAPGNAVGQTANAVRSAAPPPCPRPSRAGRYAARPAGLPAAA